jgi:hypothetical protein
MLSMRTIQSLYSRLKTCHRQKILFPLLFRRVMLTAMGEFARKKIPALRPWCPRFPSRIVILSDGSVTTCCADPFGKNSFASIYQEDLEVIWKDQIQRIIKDDLYQLQQCRSCYGPGLQGTICSVQDYRQWRRNACLYPRGLYVEPMGCCNYGCCCAKDIHRYRSVKLDLERTYGNIKSFLPKIQTLHFFNWGEPLLHDGLCDFIRQCRSGCQNLKMEISTNGYFLDDNISRCLIEAKLSLVQISLHGAPGTDNMLKYAQHGADYERVLNNARRLVEIRDSFGTRFPKVTFPAALFEWNDSEESIQRLMLDAIKCGIDAVEWCLDEFRGGFPRSSKKYILNSKELRILKEKGMNLRSSVKGMSL